MSALGHKRTFCGALAVSAQGQKRTCQPYWQDVQQNSDVQELELLASARFHGRAQFVPVQCPLWVISGQTVPGQNPPLSAIVQKADIDRRLSHVWSGMQPTAKCRVGL